MKQLTISKDLKLPLEIVTQTVAILAKRRVGKSYTMRGMAEQFLELGQQVIMVDPKGDQWGIRSSADGKKPGFAMLILGGEHGDLPLEVNGGEVVAKLAVEERVSMLLDLSTFRKHEVATFMAIFLENLYRLKAQERFRTPVMLIVDEADAIAPQKPQKGEERMLGAIEDIVRRGGQRGIGCMVVTQRSAVLNKNVLTQAQMLIVLRTIAPQDLAAMNAWIDVHGTAEERKVLMESLPSLPVGDAWFWSPGWPTAEGIFKLVHVLPIKTFDSAATPKPGEKKITPKNLADVDLDALKTQMAATIEKAKSEDPKLLRAEVSKLKRDLVILESKKVTNSPDPKAIEKAVQVAVEKNNKEWQKKVIEWEKYTTRIIHVAEDAITTIHNTKKPENYGEPKAVYNAPGVSIQKVKEEWENQASSLSETFELQNDTQKTLSKCAREILSYLDSVFPHGKSKTQLWIATGYTPSGSFNNAIYELTGNDFIVKTPDWYVATRKYDLALIDKFFRGSLEKYQNKVSLCARKILQLFLEDNSRRITKEEMIQETGYVASGSFNNAIYELTGPELIKKVDGGYIINPEILEL